MQFEKKNSGGQKAQNCSCNKRLDTVYFVFDKIFLRGNYAMIKQIYTLSEIIDEDLKRETLTETEKLKLAKEIKQILPDGYIVLAQTNPTSGDIEGNAKKALKWIKWANLLEAEAIVFPEMFLVGYPIGDFIDRFPVIVEENIEWLNALALKTTKTKVIIGFVEFNQSKKGKKYYNSIAVLYDGKVQNIIRKSLLPNYAEFNDYRHFEPSDINSDKRVLDIGNKKAGIIVCEDGWNDFDFFDKNLYSFDPVETVVKEQKPNYLINCSSSITRAKKEQLKHNMLSFAAKKHKTPIVYVNQVGSGECLSFEGASRVYDANGNLIYMAKSYQEQFFIVNPFDSEGKIYPLPHGLEKTLTEQKAFSLDHEPDLERTYLTIIQSIKDYFSKTGFKRTVLGLSGGLDSTVSAVLLTDALGAENVFGVSMPSKITSSESKNDAKILAKNLGINFIEAPIKDMFDTTRQRFDSIFSDIEKKWDYRYKESFTNDNIQARSRAMILWGIANEFQSCLPIATSDKSELYMGYATINGDMSGGFAPLADVSKTKLFALARWLNKHRENKNAIPETIIEKRPGAELAINPKTGKPLLAEEALMPYEFLDEIIWRVENLQQSIKDMLSEEFLYEKHMKEKNTPISKLQKEEWLTKFFRRMSTALYKWSIMPPSPIVDARSINKSEYKQPIISSKINYNKTSFEEKLKTLS